MATEICHAESQKSPIAATVIKKARLKADNTGLTNEEQMSQTTQQAQPQQRGRRHREQHFEASDMVRDVVLGMSDGLTVPFALAAGLTGAINSSSIVVVAGLAELAAGAISMGLGGYLAAQSDLEHYTRERCREIKEVRQVPDEEKAEVRDVFRNYGLTDTEIRPIVETLSRRPSDWVDFMMRFELGLEEPDKRRAFISAATIGLSYAAGGFIPLSPYFFIPDAHEALWLSVAVTMVALFVFGFVKGKYTGVRPFRSGLQTLVVGGLAAGAAFLLARLVSQQMH